MDHQTQEAAFPAVCRVACVTPSAVRPELLFKPQKLSSAAAELTGGLNSLSCLISKKQE